MSDLVPANIDRDAILRHLQLDPTQSLIVDRMVAVDGCWLWQAGIGARGYGLVWLNGKMRRAHRVAYEAFVGPIPDGLDLDHLCRVRSCVNPDHLEPVTRKENLRRGARWHAPESRIKR